MLFDRVMEEEEQVLFDCVMLSELTAFLFKVKYL